MEYIVLIAAWGIYFFLHSALASDGLKHRFKSLLGRNFFYYRLLYSLISIIGLFLLLMMNASIPSEKLIESAGVIRYLSLLFAGFGVIVIRLAFKEYNIASFIGFKDEQFDEFKTGGILAKVRHPIYSGTILIVIGFWLFTPNVTTLISVSCVFTYLTIGIWLEEKKLLKNFGDKYRQYKKDVPMLIPKL